jgi:hypothetical protein
VTGLFQTETRQRKTVSFPCSPRPVMRGAGFRRPALPGSWKQGMSSREDPVADAAEKTPTAVCGAISRAERLRSGKRFPYPETPSPAKLSRIFFSEALRCIASCFFRWGFLAPSTRYPPRHCPVNGTRKRPAECPHGARLRPRHKNPVTPGLVPHRSLRSSSLPPFTSENPRSARIPPIEYVFVVQTSVCHDRSNMLKHEQPTSPRPPPATPAKPSPPSSPAKPNTPPNTPPQHPPLAKTHPGPFPRSSPLIHHSAFLIHHSSFPILTFSLSHFPTFSLSPVHTFPRSHVPTFTRSQFHTFPHSPIPTFSLSHIHTFTRSHVHTFPLNTPSYSSRCRRHTMPPRDFPPHRR